MTQLKDPKLGASTPPANSMDSITTEDLKSMDHGKRTGSMSMEYLKEILEMGSPDEDEQVVHCDCSYVRMKWNEIKSMDL